MSNFKYNPKWEYDFLFINTESNELKCLVCWKQIKLKKQFNVKRHYKRHKIDQIQNEERRQLIARLKKTFDESDPHARIAQTYSYTVNEIEPDHDNEQATSNLDETMIEYVTENASIKGCTKEEESVEEDSFDEYISTENFSSATEIEFIDQYKLLLKASYKMSQEVARNVSHFDLGEGEIWKNLITEVLRTFGDEFEKSIEIIDKIDLSKDAIYEKITKVDSFLNTNIKSRIETSAFYSIAFDECDGSGHVLIVIRMIDTEYNISEDLLGCIIKDENIFENIQKLLDQYNVNFENIVSICSPGPNSSLSSFFCMQNVNIQEFHCIIHEDKLLSTSCVLNDTMNTILELINVVRLHSSTSVKSIFETFLIEFETEHNYDLLFGQVTWISKATILKKIFDLRNHFLHVMKTNQNSCNINETAFLLNLAFLCDITKCLNEFCERQGKPAEHVFEMLSIVDGFQSKLLLIKDSLKYNQVVYLECCTILSKEVPSAEFSIFVPEIDILITGIKERFSNLNNVYTLTEVFYNPLSCSIKNQPLDLHFELCDLQANFVKRQCGRKLIEFWKTLPTENYSSLHNSMLRVCAMFGDTHICRRSFVRLKETHISGQCRYPEDQLQNILRVAVSETVIDYDLLTDDV